MSDGSTNVSYRIPNSVTGKVTANRASEFATYQYQLPVRVTSYADDFASGYSQQWNVNLQRDNPAGDARVMQVW